MMSKTCCRCLLPKPTTEFHKSKRGLHGVHSICKVCKAAYLTKAENIAKSNSFDGTYGNNAWRSRLEAKSA